MRAIRESPNGVPSPEFSTSATASPRLGSAHAPDAAAAGVDRVRVAASERYQAKRIHRFALGSGYRDLWEAEIELPVLNLATEGGGLVPSGRFGVRIEVVRARTGAAHH